MLAYKGASEHCAVAMGRTIRSASSARAADPCRLPDVFLSPLNRLPKRHEHPRAQSQSVHSTPAQRPVRYSPQSRSTGGEVQPARSPHSPCSSPFQALRVLSLLGPVPTFRQLPRPEKHELLHSTIIHRRHLHYSLLHDRARFAMNVRTT